METNELQNNIETNELSEEKYLVTTATLGPCYTVELLEEAVTQDGLDTIDINRKLLFSYDLSDTRINDLTLGNLEISDTASLIGFYRNIIMLYEIQRDRALK